MTLEPNDSQELQEPEIKKSSIANLVIGTMLAFGVLAILAGLFLPATSRARPETLRPSCSNNLRLIRMAMMSYEKAYGRLPPEYTVDASGKPLHSWRTLLLPYLGEQKLYDSIDLTKPWDDPKNLVVGKKMPSCFVCFAFHGPSNHTCFHAAVTSGSAIQPVVSHRWSDVTDNSDFTILAIESSVDQAVPWMSPRDVDWNEFTAHLATTNTPHKSGVFLLMCDGAVYWMKLTMDPAVLQSLVTIAGGETIRADVFED